MAVWRIDVGPNIDQEVHDAIVGPTDGVVQGGDALVVRLARVVQLWQEKAVRGSASRIAEWHHELMGQIHPETQSGSTFYPSKFT